MPRRFPIFQLPNRPLIAAMFAGAIAKMTHGAVSRDAMLLSRLALLVWSAEEIATGANWFRRLLGVAGGACGLATLEVPGGGGVRTLDGFELRRRGAHARRL